MENFNLRKYLKEGSLLKEETSGTTFIPNSGTMSEDVTHPSWGSAFKHLKENFYKAFDKFQEFESKNPSHKSIQKINDIFSKLESKYDIDADNIEEADKFLQEKEMRELEYYYQQIITYIAGQNLGLDSGEDIEMRRWA